MDVMVQDPPCLSPDEAPRQGWLRRLLHRMAFVDTPARAAGAFSLGVFLSFSPFLGLQTAIGMGAAIVLRLSRIGVFAGLCMNLPWFMVPWYTLTTLAAAGILGTPVTPELGPAFGRVLEIPVYRAGFWTEAGELLAPFFWAFILGPTVGAAAVAVLTYLVTLRIFTRVRRAAASQA